MRKLLLGGIAALCLAGCSPQQVQMVNTYQAQIATACALAMPLAPGAGPIAPYIVGGCATEEAIAKLALDPNSLNWVNGLIAQVKAAPH